MMALAILYPNEIVHVFNVGYLESFFRRDIFYLSDLTDINIDLVKNKLINTKKFFGDNSIFR